MTLFSGLMRFLKKYYFFSLTNSKFQNSVPQKIGYVQQNREEMEVLFTLLADRYERSSIMITSNLPFSRWEKIFKDPMVTAAAIDRLVHHSVILELNLESYRVVEAKRSEKSSMEPRYTFPREMVVINHEVVSKIRMLYFRTVSSGKFRKKDLF